ncbi:NUDIX hydrolase [Dongia rigui]|uniref:NUDIX domain-containing protein n=1 Tax=Dongia rigui TaxID=940149 RepID=A0ABU5DSV8_9PROT|nr:NUDIX domain-containing protein [Dongia rigui]MDY0870449.1 NUDIX domain-containing protein [Dongia rigui]
MIAKPRDAAGLVLIRAAKKGPPEILIGRRPSKMDFLPGIHVVPGGRVDPEDALPGPGQPHPAVAAQLGPRWAAFMNAALRETFEETGLLHGRGDSNTVPAHSGSLGGAYDGQKWAPDYASLDYLCRAITPVTSRRRFNTRFFLGDGAKTLGTLAGNGELEDLAWIPTPHLGAFNLVDVTEYVLKTAIRRWESGIPIGAEPAKLLNYRSDILTLQTMRKP